MKKRLLVSSKGGESYAVHVTTPLGSVVVSADEDRVLIYADNMHIEVVDGYGVSHDVILEER